MTTKKLFPAQEQAKQLLLDALQSFVLKNGDNMNDYYYNEFGINEEDDGEIVVKVLNLSDRGCFFSFQNFVNDDEIKDNLINCFTHVAFWALYVTLDAGGDEHLKYYRFVNGGVTFDEEDSEPDHDYANKLSLAELQYIMEAITYTLL